MEAKNIIKKIPIILLFGLLFWSGWLLVLNWQSEMIKLSKEKEQLTTEEKTKRAEEEKKKEAAFWKEFWQDASAQLLPPDLGEKVQNAQSKWLEQGKGLGAKAWDWAWQKGKKEIKEEVKKKLDD